MEKSDLKNIAIQCVTEYEADACCKLADKLGWKWYDGSNYIDIYWCKFKNNTVYDFYNNCSRNINYALYNGYKIKSAQWFLDNFTPKENNNNAITVDRKTGYDVITEHSVRVKVKKLNDNAVIPFKTYGKDFCYDVVATSCEEISPNVFKYGIGLAFEMCDTGENNRISIGFRARSSVWKTGMVLSNCVGTIDELYRGEVSAIFYKVIPQGEPYKVGDRIGQICREVTTSMTFEEVDELSPTERGSGGFGSTGK